MGLKTETLQFLIYISLSHLHTGLIAYDNFPKFRMHVTCCRQIITRIVTEYHRIDIIIKMRKTVESIIS